jgi:hypothetical protein
VKFLDASHPFFAAKWRRWATCLLPLAWAGVEFYTRNPGWAVLFAGFAAYAYYHLFLLAPKE